MNNKLKIVLLTIDRAGQILIERLLGVLPSNISIELVITRETRNYDFNGNPVVNACEKGNIKYIQPDFKEKDYLDIVKRINPDLIIISNFHKIIKKELIELSKIGTFNLHSSLLPELRGGTSVIWALKNGLTQTGVTLHYVTEGIDDGDVISKKTVEIDFWDTQGTLYEKITIAKFEVLVSFLFDISQGKDIVSEPQNHEKATYLPKRKDSDGLIDIKSSMLEIYNHLRSFDPWTGAYFEINGRKIRLRNVIPVKEKLDFKIGDNYLILNKECNSGIRSFIIQSVTDIVERPEIFDKELAYIVFKYWKKNIENE
jgi:methionyl-tRNA formyltransferase